MDDFGTVAEMACSSEAAEEDLLGYWHYKISAGVCIVQDRDQQELVMGIVSQLCKCRN